MQNRMNVPQKVNDPRTNIPECPLAYEVPYIPASHTALVISISTADIHWQEKMLPWTVASLINNTDIVSSGVHLYIRCENGNLQERIQTAMKRFYLPKDTITRADPRHHDFLANLRSYDSVCTLDVHYWAFRGLSKSKDAAIKLPLGHILRHTWGWAAADYSLHSRNTTATEPKKRDSWLHDAHRAVFGENYQHQSKTLTPYFFNDSEPNWHLDTSILHYRTRDITADFLAFAAAWEHLGTDAFLALYLQKTGQNAYNIRNSIAIDSNYTRATDARLCNMKSASPKDYRAATQDLMGAHMSIAM